MRPFSPHRDRTRGFSLLELTLVLAIMGISAAIAVPYYGASIARYRVDAAARRVAADLVLARSQATTTSKSQSVSFDTSRQSYQMAGVPRFDRAAGTYQVQLAAEPYLATIVSVNFGNGPQVTFDAYGSPSSGGQLVLQVGAAQQTVTVDGSTGKASVP